MSLPVPGRVNGFRNRGLVSEQMSSAGSVTDSLFGMGQVFVKDVRLAQLGVSTPVYIYDANPAGENRHRLEY